MNDDYAIPPAHTAFNFTTVNQIQDKSPNSCVDVAGMVVKCEEIISNLIRGELKERKAIELVDDTLTRVQITFWGTNTI